MNNQGTSHIQFMAQLSTQMAKFFMAVTQMCIGEIRKQTIHTESKQSLIQQQNNRLKHDKNCSQQTVVVNPQNKTISDNVSLSQVQKKQLLENQNENIKSTQVQVPSSIQKRKGRPRTRAITITHKPKAPTSSFLLFLHQKKNDIAGKYNISSNSQLTRMASEQWKKLSQTQKSKYHKLSQEEQTRYHGAMKIYKEQYAEQIKQERRKKQFQYKLKWLQKKKAQKQAQQLKSKIKPIVEPNQNISQSSSSNSYISSPDLDQIPHQQLTQAATSQSIDKHTNPIGLLQKKTSSI